MPTTTCAPIRAAEPAAIYQAAGNRLGSGSAGSVGVAFPVLAEVPELGALLDNLRQADRLLASAVDSIIRLQDAAVAETATGVPLEQWLLIVARRTGTDRRMLLTAADVCRRVPALREAFIGGRVSWSQVRTLALQVHKLPRRLDGALDAAVEQAICRAETADPDDLGSLTSWLVSDLQAADDPTTPDDDEPPAEFLALQPRLDGSGGRFWGEAGPTSFAVLEAATDPGPGSGPSRERFGATPDPDRVREIAKDAGLRRLAKLLDRLEHTCNPTHGADAGLAPVQLLVRAELSTLCDRTQVPGQLLTKLAGGRMILTSNALRRLINTRGAQLRTIVLDDAGGVVGVGRRTQIPPGWLSDAVLALHDTCTEPGCNVAARACDLDHARPWHPVRPDDPPGTTNADNLGPLCRPANRTKEADGWRADQTADGTRTWRHQRTGLTIDTLPATTRIRVPDAPPDQSAPARAGPLRASPPRDRPAPPPDRPPDPSGTDPPLSF